MSEKSQKIGIVGAGIQGVCNALFLQKKGFQVTLFDRDEPGNAASYGNAGHFSPYASVSLNRTDILTDVPQMLIITFIGTIIMGLFKFDIIFVVFSVSIVMIGMHLLYDSIRRRYDILSKKNENFSKIKPVLDYSVMALILYKIIN